MARGTAFRLLVVAFGAAVAIVTGGAGASGTATARSADVSAPDGIAPSGMISIEPARTLASLADAPSIAAPPPPANAFIDRPGMPLADYRAAKAAAAATPAQPSVASQQPHSTNTLQGHAALSGQGAAGEVPYFPSDINGAVGLNQVATVTNSHLSVYTKSPSSPTLLAQKTLNTLVGVSNADLFDPRIEFDTRWNRWVITSDSFADGTGTQHLWIAISQTSDATGAYLIYSIPWNEDVNGTLDYPQFGLSQDAVVVTYSVFAGSSQSVSTFSVAKAVLYNGAGLSTPVFTIASRGTLTPPNVIDQSPRVHELLEVPAGSVSNVFLQNAGDGAYSLITSIAVVSGVSTAVPPQAQQPGACAATSCSVDTSDARFVNDLTQYGNELWGANTVLSGGRATPFFYDIWAEGATKNTVRQSGALHATATSSDWNVSVVALAQGRAMVTWSYDDPAQNVNPSMAMTGRIPTDTVGSMNPPTTVFTSTHNLQGNYDANFGAQRWGDTSSIRYDPGTARTFGFNETVSSDGTNWGSHEGVLSLS